MLLIHKPAVARLAWISVLLFGATVVQADDLTGKKDTARAELRAPSAAEMRTLALLTAKASPAKATIRQLPDGTIVGTVDDSMVSYELASKDATGRIAADCSTGSEGAKSIAQDTAATTQTVIK